MGWGRNEDKAEKFDKLLNHIKEVAERDCWPDEDDFCPIEFSGSNFYDAYEGGKIAGEVMFSRYLLKLIGESSNRKLKGKLAEQKDKVDNAETVLSIAERIVEYCSYNTILDEEVKKEIQKLGRRIATL